MRKPYKSLSNKFTIIVVENHELKQKEKQYKLAINVLDHIIHMHTQPLSNKKPGAWKYVEYLKEEDIKSCTTEFVLVMKIGTRLNIRVIFDNFDFDNVSLMGHILDGNANHLKDRYYILHDQCFIVKTKDYDTTRTKTLRHVMRSEENFHDRYTPIWVADGGKEIPLQKKLNSHSFLISNLLRQGKKIEPFNETIRKDKRYLYDGSDPKKVRKFIKRNQKVFAWSTETQYDINEVDILSKNHFVGCANGLQALLYMNPNMKTIDLFDINKNALTFSQNFFEKWSMESYSEFVYQQADYANYQMTSVVGHKEIPLRKMTPEYLDEYFFHVYEMNPTIIDVIKNIQSGKIKIRYHHKDITKFQNIFNVIDKPKTVLYFSNVSNYSITAHRHSMLQTDLLFKEIFAYADKSSVFIGSTAEFHFKHMNLQEYEIKPSTHLKYPWRLEEYANYEKRIKQLR